MSESMRGLPAISVDTQTSVQVWKLIEKDYTLRLSLVASDWAREHLMAWNAVFAEGRKRNNSAYYGPALVEMEIADQDKRAEWAYRTCCEIWEVQGRTKHRSFFRAIFEFCLQPMFLVRHGSFKYGLELHQKRIGTAALHRSAAVNGHMTRELGKLRAKWNTKLEIATRDNEYELQRLSARVVQPWSGFAPEHPQTASSDPNGELLSASQVHTAATSFTWRELEIRFQQIQAKPMMGQKVAADFTRTEWESGLVSESWLVRGELVCRTEFERLASIAARKLGYAIGEDATKHWLGCVREWLHTTGLDKQHGLTWCPTGQGHEQGKFYKTFHLNSEQIAELSAMFCIEMLARGAPESALSSVLEKSRETRFQSRASEGQKRGKRTKSQLRKMGVIFGVLQSDLRAAKYCAALDQRRVQPPNAWIEENCPSTYAQAYKDPQWRKRIQDEKHRYHKEYKATSPKDREAIIQGDASTRRTRG